MIESAGMSLSLMSEGTRTAVYSLGQLFSLVNTLVQTTMYFVKRHHHQAQDHD